MTFPADHRPARARRLRALAALLLALAVAGACTGAPPSDTASGPDQRIAGFISAWQQNKPAAAAEFTSDPAAASTLLGEVTGNLRPDSLTISTGGISQLTQDTATTTATFTWQLPNAGTWSYPATWTWQRASANADWLLDWSPTVVHPQLAERQTLAVKTSEAEQGVMVDRNNNQLVSPIRVYSVVLSPGQLPDLAAAAAALAAVLTPVDPTITADSIVAGATAAATQPSGSATGTADPGGTGYTVISLREPDYLTVKAQLDAIPGLSFPSVVRNLPPTRDFARAVLGQLGSATTTKLAGTGGWQVIIVDNTGGALQTLEDQPAIAGERVVLTLDSALQQAAEAALAPIPQPAVLLVMQPSTGELLAVAQNSAANAQGTPAFTGQYPPGSTFKVVTATAGLGQGLIAPGQPVDCPGVFEVDGRVIRNSHDFALGTVDATLAFAKSCNTTFASVATQLPGDALPAAAAGYGIGLDFVMAGATTLTGSVPDATTNVHKAENGFGQGQVLITPFSAVLMAATAASGSMPLPVLIRGTTTTVDKPAPARTPQVTQAVQTFMRAVVEEGTATQLRQFGDVHAKTGTAEFTADDGATHAHAWTVGYVGDLAFADLIVGGEDSVHTNEVLERFLTAVPR